MSKIRKLKFIRIVGITSRVSFEVNVRVFLLYEARTYELVGISDFRSVCRLPTTRKRGASATGVYRRPMPRGSSPFVRKFGSVILLRAISPPFLQGTRSILILARSSQLTNTIHMICNNNAPLVCSQFLNIKFSTYVHLIMLWN